MGGDKKMKWSVKALKAASIAWIVTMILMLMNIFYEILKEGRLSILSMVFFVSFIVYFSSLLYFRKAR